METGNELVWKVGDEFLTVDIGGEIEGMTAKGGSVVFGDLLLSFLRE
jgi:hypothetical protein